MFKNLFQMSGISLERLQAFLAVSEAGGMTRAAGGDPSKQSLFSRQVKELEEFFGTDLVQRSGRGIQLTTKGKELAAAIRESFTALSEFQESCGNHRQTYSIGAGQALLQWIVLPTVIKLQNKAADADFSVQNLRTQDVVEGVTELKTDFGLVRSNAVGPRHDSAVLGFMDYTLYVPKKLLHVPLRSGWRLVLDKVPLATMVSDGQFRSTLLAAAEKARIELRIALACASFPLAAEALVSGQYAAILPTMAGRAFDRKRFHSISVPFLKSQVREIRLIWNRRLPSVRKQSRGILDLLKSELRF